MKLAIKTNVPTRHKRMGQALSIFLVGGSLFCWLGGLAMWLFTSRTLPTDFVIVCLLMLPGVPVALMLLVPPMFFGGYPQWIVNIFGKAFLSELVDSLVAGVALDRKKQREGQCIFSPLADRRNAFALLVALCLIAGLLSGFFH